MAGRVGVYGDAEDPEFTATLPLDTAAWVVIATPPVRRGVAHDDARTTLLDNLRRSGFKGKVAVRCHDGADMQHFKNAGADVVLLPFSDAADYAVNLLGIKGEALREGTEILAGVDAGYLEPADE
jgi:hypothetical protein